MEAAKSERGEATPFHAGFVLGPRINAGGRIGRSDLGAQLLSSDDVDEVRNLAGELDRLNAERREVERDITEAATLQVERSSNFDPEAPIVLAAGEGWHPGVIGVVAGRLKERWHRPVVVVGLDAATGIGKGSGRSIAGVNLGRAVQDAFDAGLLLAGGGHAMAAGLTVETRLLPDLRAFLAERLAAEAEAAIQADALEIDVLTTARGADRDLYDSFQVLAPFGPGNPEPSFVLAGVSVRDARVLNNGHVSCRLADPDGKQVRAIAWRAAETEVGKALLGGGGALDVAGLLKADDWNGRRGVQFEIADVHDPRRAV
jgi:single-stranded-DNA-specific exonuclease